MTTSDTGLHYVILRDYSTPLINRYKIEYYEADTGKEIFLRVPVSCLYSYTIWGAHRKARKFKGILAKSQNSVVDEGVI